MNFTLKACKGSADWCVYFLCCFLCLHTDAIPSIKTLAEESKPQYANMHKNSIAVAAVPSAKKGLVGTGVTSDAEEAEEELEEQNVRGAMKALLHWCQKNTAGLVKFCIQWDLSITDALGTW